jgi:hypothetical protein
VPLPNLSEFCDMVGNEVVDERSEGESSELIDPDSTNESKKQRFSARNGKMPDALLPEDQIPSAPRAR